MEHSAKTRGDYFDSKTGKYYESSHGGRLDTKIENDDDCKKHHARDTTMHCGGTSNAIKKLYGTKNGQPIMARVHGYHNIQDNRNRVEHAWNRTKSGAIIDASREQFGDAKGVHIIKPDDPRFHKYTEFSEYSNNGSQWGGQFTVPIIPELRKIREQNDKRVKRYQNKNTQPYYEDEALEKFGEHFK